MKISLEIDLDNKLTPDELEAFRRQCESKATAPEARIADLIRAALEDDKLQPAA